MSSYRDFGYNSYAEYLQGPEWQKTNERYFSSNLSKYCFVCDNPTILIHHEDYSRLGKEDLRRDVVALCMECHKKAHFDETGERIPLTKAALVERRVELRKRYVHAHFNPSTFWYFFRRAIYRFFY